MRPRSTPPLVRRVCEDGVVRELVHPPDGSMPVERPVGSALAATAAIGDGSEAVAGRLGQLVLRDVAPADRSRPLALPLLRSACNGTGSCCAVYHHIPVTAEERDRIVPLLREGWDRPVPIDEVFHPAFDAQPEGPLNVLAVEGSCALLDSDGLCSAHKAGGAQCKPEACLTFPAQFVVCGERWYASLKPECACAPRTALEGPKLSADPEVWARLRQRMLTVWTVPNLVEVDGGRVITRTAYRGWVEEQVAGLSTTFDGVETLFAGLHELDLLAGLPQDSSLPARAADLLDDAWLSRAKEWLTRAVEIARFAHARRSPARLALEWGLLCVDALLDGHPRELTGSRGRAADWSRRAALTTGLLLHGHGLLEAPLLRPAFIQLIRIAAMARASRAVQPLEGYDSRLEEMTTWLYLWRTLGPGVW